MKPSEIVVGGLYTNGKGAHRRVDMVLRREYQINADCVGYVVEAGRMLGRKAVMTRLAFAAWATSRIDAPAAVPQPEEPRP